MSIPVPATPPNARLPGVGSTIRAFGALIVLSFQRHWRVRQMGWVSLGLLTLVLGAVILQTESRQGWDLPDKRVRRGLPTYRAFAEQQLPSNRYHPERHQAKSAPVMAPIAPSEVPAPFDPVKNGIQSLLL